MKKKLLVFFPMVIMLALTLAFLVNAEVVTYEDAPAKEKIQTSTDDVVVFDDGFTCPSAYIFKDTDRISDGDHMGNIGLRHNVDFSFINEKTGKEYTIANIVELDIPEGIVHLGKYGLTRCPAKRVSIPKTATSIGGCCFEKSTALEQCVFEHTSDSALEALPSWMFQGCTSLVAFSFPECIKAINTSYEFSGCTSLTAVYLPKNLTAYNTPSNDQQSVFWNCKNMYFVSEPFTYDNIPSKPAVYYMPSGLTSVSGELFKNCENLNETLVFPVGVTEITNSWAFKTNASTVKNIVFLGDMTSLNTSNWNLASEAKIIFANANDVGSGSLTSLSGGHTKIYCATEADLSKHLAEKTVSSEASCETNKGTYTYCFCGAVISSVEEEGTMLGHEYDVEKGAILVSITYASYDNDGVKTVACANCGENRESAVDALFVSLGFSITEIGNGGIAAGYMVNDEAIGEYEAFSGKTVKYGLFAVSQEKLGDSQIFGKDGELASGAICVDTSSYEFEYFELKIVGFAEENKDSKMAIGAYVTEGEEYSYIQAGTPEEGESYYFASYNDIVALLSK